MNSDIDRIKQDLSTIQAALRREPDFDQRHVWQSIGLGIWGALFILFGFVPRAVPPYLLAGILVVLLFALPRQLPRIFCPEALTAPSAGDKAINSVSAAIILPILSLGIIFWVSRLTPAPKNMVFAMIFLMAAAWAFFSAWGKPWWRSLLVVAAAFGATGFAMPFLPKGMIGPAMGAAMVIGGFGSAAMLHYQLKAYYAHGKAAH